METDIYQRMQNLSTNELKSSLISLQESLDLILSADSGLPLTCKSRDFVTDQLGSAVRVLSGLSKINFTQGSKEEFCWKEIEKLAGKLVKSLVRQIVSSSHGLSAAYGYEMDHSASGRFPPLVNFQSSPDLVVQLRADLCFYTDILSFIMAHTDIYGSLISSCLPILRVLYECLGKEDFIGLNGHFSTLLLSKEALELAPSISKCESDILPMVSVNCGPDDTINRLLDKNHGLDFDLDALNTLEQMTPFLNKLSYAQKMIESLKDADAMVDIRVRFKYFAIFKRAFDQLTRKDKLKAMEKFYNLYGATANFQKSYDKFSEDLLRTSGQITDHSSTSSEQIDTLVDRFAWLFVISPKATLWNLLSLSMDVSNTVPTVIKILRQLYPVSRLVADSSGQPLFLVALNRLLSKKKIHEDLDQMDKFLLILTSLAREKPNKNDLVPSELALLDPNLILKEMCFGLLKCPGREKLSLLMLKRLLSNTNVRLRWSMELVEVKMWVGDKIDEASDSLPHLDAAKLLIALCTISQQPSFNNISPLSAELSSFALDSIKSLSKRLLEQNLKFTSITCDWLEQKLAEFSWQLKFCVVTWMQDAFSLAQNRNVWKPQAPQCFVKGLPIIVSSLYYPINCSFHSEEECLFRSFFELSLVDVDIVKSLLDQGLSFKIGTEFLRERICVVLSEFLPHSSTEIWKNFLCLLKILAAKLDPFRPLTFMNEINLAAFEAVIQVNPLLLLGDAVVMALHSNEDDIPLIDRYCRLCKDEADDTMTDFRTNRTVRMNGPDKNIKAVIALKQLYLQTCSIANVFTSRNDMEGLKSEIPNSLKMLLVSLTESNEQVHDTLTQWSGLSQSDETQAPPPVTFVQSEHCLEALRYPAPLPQSERKTVELKEDAYRKLTGNQENRPIDDSRDSFDDWTTNKSISPSFGAKGFGADVPSVSRPSNDVRANQEIFDSFGHQSREDQQRKRDLMATKENVRPKVEPMTVWSQMVQTGGSNRTGFGNNSRYHVIRRDKHLANHSRNVWSAATRTLEPQTRQLVESRIVPKRPDNSTQQNVGSGPFKNAGGYEGRQKTGRHHQGRKGYRRK